MKKITLGLLFVCLCVSTSLLLIGCKTEKIMFNRESQASKIIQKFSVHDEQEVKRNSGVIILKDDNDKVESIHFGPRDINFDMPIRFK